jgi:hypothetical protein
MTKEFFTQADYPTDRPSQVKGYYVKFEDENGIHTFSYFAVNRKRGVTPQIALHLANTLRNELKIVSPFIQIASTDTLRDEMKESKQRAPLATTPRDIARNAHCKKYGF